MRSRLNYFYNDNALEIRNKLLIENPFYIVNEYIKGFNIDKLNDNYINNLRDLNIDPNRKKGYICCYDNDNNLLYSKNFTGDIMGLFHVSSNNRNKAGYGVVNEKNEGIGLNDGITSLFTNIVTDEKLLYPIEALIAEALLLIDDKIIAKAYFNNDQDILNNYNLDLHKFNKILDKIHKDYLLLSCYYNLSITTSFKHFSYIFSNHYKKENIVLLEELNKIKSELISSIYLILDNIIMIVLNSNIEKVKKDTILEMLNEDLTYIIFNERMLDLREFNNYIINNTPKKGKILCKK